MVEKRTTVLLGVIGMLLSPIAAHAQTHAQAGKPNIVIIFNS